MDWKNADALAVSKLNHKTAYMSEKKKGGGVPIMTLPPSSSAVSDK